MVNELLRLPPTERRSTVGDEPSFHSAAVLEELLSRSRDAIFDDPQAGLELASMGVTVAERLDPETYSPQLCNDLLGRAWADLGNARRVLSDHRGAEEAFELASEHIAAGTGDPLEAAHLHYCRNVLLEAQAAMDLGVRYAEGHATAAPHSPASTGSYVTPPSGTPRSAHNPTAAAGNPSTPESLARLWDASHEATFNDPALAVRLAEEAIDLLQQLSGDEYSFETMADVRAHAWAALGNALVVVSDLRGAQAALENAEDALRQGSGDPLEAARLAYLWGSLRGSQRRFTEAIGHLDRAIAIYRRIGDGHQQGKGLVAKGAVLAKAGDPTASIRLQRQALEMLDPAREPRAFIAAQHNLLADLTDMGRCEEGLELLAKVRALYQHSGDEVSLLRLQWIEAQLERQRGGFEPAERLLREVRQAFAALEMPFDDALVGLELATLYAEQGRTAEIKQLALEMLPIFQALEIQREAIAALMLFRQAAEAETASLALIQHIAGFLKRAQHDPAARFSPPS
jgi:tetratricopeptide (TPR) repeat protein